MSSDDQLLSLVVSQSCEAGLVLSRDGQEEVTVVHSPELKHTASLFSCVDWKEDMSQLGGCSVIIRKASPACCIAEPL